MLYLSLVPAALLVLTAHVAARPHPKPIGWTGFLILGFVTTIFPCGFVFASPVAFGLWVLLGVALLVWKLNRRRVRYFFPYSFTALLFAYGFAGLHAWKGYTRFADLQARYPFESMVDRVPEPRHDERRGAPGGPEPDAKNLEFRSRFHWRVYGLQYLHERTTDAFVNSPGFGVTRMRAAPTEGSMKPFERPEPPPQPESPGSPWALGEVQFTLPGHDREAFGQLHADGLIDFVNPEGWGYVRSRREVAGFLPHAFSRVPEAREWKVVRVELVGLLRHPEPVAYPSDRLPAMADLAAGTAPTRPLDAFEAAGLEAIRRGEDGFAGRRGDEVRYVGAVRSAAACVTCHGGERGDLLGAFAYRLRPAGR